MNHQKSNHEYGEGNYKAADRYQQGASAHAGTEESRRAAEAARHDRDVNASQLDAAEREGKARAAEFDPELYRPTWWNKECDSLWDQAKSALARDWEQTKNDFSKSSGEDLDQSVGDTIKQIVGAEPVPARQGAVRDNDDWRTSEAMARAGFAAGLQSKDTEWNEQSATAMRTEMSDRGIPGSWDDARPYARFGWYASHGAPMATTTLRD